MTKEQAYQVIYEELKSVARARRTAFYGNLSEAIDLPGRSRQFHEILDLIDAREHRKGRPLLSALAVRRGFGIPGNGFFEQARILGRFTDRLDDTSHVAFWVEEVHRSWDYWEKY